MMDADVGQMPGLIAPVEVALDPGYSARGRVGPIALATDAASLASLRAMKSALRFASYTDPVPGYGRLLEI